MLRLLLPIVLFFSGVQLLHAQVNCDTVSVIAQADDAFLTCVTPTAVLEAFQAPGLTDYHWSGPNGFSADTFRIVQNIPGTYTLTVTGKYGCTAQTTAQIIDFCDFIALVPPACSNPVYQANDDCADICVSPGLSQLDSTHNYTAGNPPAIFCDGVENDQWWGFVAGASAGTISIKADTCENGDGIQIGLYDGCQTAPLFCNPGYAGGEDSTLHLQVSGLIPGKVYFLMIDGYDGDKCKFKIEDPGGICSGGSSGGGSINGPTKVCPGATVVYNLSGAGINTAFYWTAPPGATINGQPSPALLYTPAGGSVTITFGNSGGSVCVRTVNYFEPPGAPVCLYVIMMPIPPTTIPQEIVCAENTPYVWGPDPSQVLNAPGTYNLQATLQSYLGCDSVVHQRVIVRPFIQTNIGVVIRCKEECFTINGSDYCSPGVFAEVLTSYQGCDSIVIFNLIILDPQASITSSGELNCVNNTVNLSAGGSAGTRQWRNPAGQVIGTGTSITVSQPGIYTLTVTIIQGGVSCSKTASMNVPFNATPVTASALPNGFISCQQPIVQINGSASVSGSNFAWTGPGGYTATTPTISVGTPGVYTLIVTAPSLCKDTLQVVVTQNINPPGAAAQGGSLTCDLPTITLQSNAGTANPVNYNWSGPGGFTSDLQAPEVNLAGSYQVIATDLTNGCTSSAQATVTWDTLPPQIILEPFYETTCSNPDVILEPVVSPNPLQVVWTGPDGFTSDDLYPLVWKGGQYTITVTGPNGCTAAAETWVSNNMDLPVSNFNAEPITCQQPSTVITSIGNYNNLVFAWTGPNGFSSSDPQPVVTEPGQYICTVEHSSNGCQLSFSITVEGDVQLPDISAEDGVLTCAEPEIELTAVSTTPDVQIQWSGNGQTSNEPTLAVTEPGTYTATAIVPNGCTSSIAVEVSSTISVPNVNVLQIPPGCGDTLLYMDASSSTPDVVFSWIGPGGVLLGDSEDISVSEPGWYRVKVTTPDGCSNQIQILAVPAPEFPEIQISGDSISCTYPTGNLSVASNMPGTLIDVDVDPLQGWIIHATAPNGCVATQTVQPVLDVTPPDLFAEGATLTCAAPVATLTAQSSTPGVAIYWIGNGIQVPGPTASISQEGTYTAIATAPNGCTSTVTVEVVDSCTTSIPGEVSIKKLNIRVFPNPSSGHITVESIDGAPIVALQVWNTQGQLITHKPLDMPLTRTDLELPAIPAGTYYLNVQIQGVWHKQSFTVVR